MNDKQMVRLTAASAAVGIFSPIGWAAFAGLQAYYWSGVYLDSRKEKDEEVTSDAE